MAQLQNATAFVRRGVLAPTKAVETYLQALDIFIKGGITPIAVFDGAPRPAKAAESADRAGKRQAARDRVESLCAAGAPADEVQRAVVAAAYVSTDMRVAAIRVAHQLGVRVVVAPLEADGQLVWLYAEEGATRVMTSDGDLAILGCNVVRVPQKGALSFIDDSHFLLYDFGDARLRVVGPPSPAPFNMLHAVARHGLWA